MKSIIIFLFTLTSISAFSQLTVTGSITDNDTHETLIGATIFFPEIHKGTTTNTSGQYKITELPKGTFNMKISFIGYKTRLIHIHLTQDTTINITLGADLKEMKEVIITGLSKSTELRINPVPAIITSRDQLFELQATNLIDGLANQPGIEQITTGSAISKPVIRGLGSNRLLVLYNGLRQEGQQWGDEHGIEIDEFSIDKVEIIKGPGSIAYGSDAMAGVINFLTPHEVESGNITGSIDAGYQTNNHQYNISGATSGNINGINWRARATAKQAGNYQNRFDGKVFNSGFNEIDWDAQIGINKNWGFSHFYISNFNQHVGLVEGERDNNGVYLKLDVDSNGLPTEKSVTDKDLNGYQIHVPNQRIRHFRLGSSSQFYFNKSSLMLNMDYQINQREEFGNIIIPTEQELYFKLKTINYSVKFFLPEYDHWATSLGVNGMLQGNKNLGEEVLIPEYDLFDMGLYALTQKEFNKIMISGGLRIDNRTINSRQLIINDTGLPEIKFAAFTKQFFSFSGSFGMSYRPAEAWNFKINFARGFRAPTLAELSSNGVHEGSFRYEYGNLNLKPEASLQADFGIELDTEHAALQIAAFYNHIDNYIFLQKLPNSQGNDSIPDPANGSIAFKYVQSAANLFGGEAGIDLHPHPFHWLHFENTFSVVYARQIDQPDSSKHLPFIPAPKFKSELRANIIREGHAFNTSFIKLEWEYYFEQNRIFNAYNTETKTPAYALLNAGVGTSIKNNEGKKLLSIVLLANNLLDIGYQSHLSRLKYAPVNLATGKIGVYNMGRNFTIKMVVPILFK